MDEEKANEEVLAVPTSIILASALEQGYFLGDEDVLPTLNRYAIWLKRGHAEEDPAYKQIIPYTVIINKSSDILAYRRTKNQGEERLHDRWSIGFGGHINPPDVQHVHDGAPGNFIWAGAIRELNEEVYVPGIRTMYHAGFVNDDENPVGEVHLGVVFEAITATDDFIVNEPDKIEATWISRAELTDILEEGEQLESWSAYILASMLQIDGQE